MTSTRTTKTTVYTLSVETAPMRSEEEGYFIPDLDEAKREAETRFHARRKGGLPCHSVAVIQYEATISPKGDYHVGRAKRRIVDVYDGAWASEYDIDDLYEALTGPEA